MKKALLLIDLQNDFMPTGALPVPAGDEVISVANELQNYFEIIVASQDWHPASHQSFAIHHPSRQPGEVIDLHGIQQVLWPVHCVQHTHGAELVKTLDAHHINTIIQKGSDETIDSYSAFFDNEHRKKTKLDDYLKSKEIDTLYIMGLATDYCVKFSALDARALGYKTYLIKDGCRGIDINPDDITHALEEMREAGVEIIQSDEVRKLKRLARTI